MIAKKVTIFYAIPLSVNNVWDVEKAARYFSYYDIIVFGSGVEDPNDEFHEENREIIRRILKTGKREIFGYLDVGVNTNNFSMREISEIVENWRRVDASGIFLDNAGFINEVSRERLNEVVDHIHSRGLSVMVNCWNPDDVLGSFIDPLYNPRGIESHLGPNDYYLNESFVVNTEAFKRNDGFQSQIDIKIKSERCIKYRCSKGIKIIAIGIVNYHNYLDEEINFFFKMHECFSLIYSFDGYGVCDYMYASPTSLMRFHNYLEIDGYYIKNPLPHIRVNEDFTEWRRKLENGIEIVAHLNNSKKERFYKYIGL
ncbi:MAG: hypothetical protein ACTSVF_02705 [Candidatus Asgardarchaeia archaeon]